MRLFFQCLVSASVGKELRYYETPVLHPESIVNLNPKPDSKDFRKGTANSPSSPEFL